MGKSAPKPPPAPDPATVINAESNANNASALTQSKLNDVNYSGPQGTVTYNYDPGSGQYTQNVSLTPTLDAANSAYQYDQRLGANIAGEQLDQIRAGIGQPLTPPNLAHGVNPGAIQYGYDQGGAIQRGIDNTPVQTGFGDSGPIQSGIHSPGAIQGQVAPTYSPFGALGLGQGQASATAPPTPSGQMMLRGAPQAGSPQGQGAAQGAPAAGQQPAYNAAQQAFLQQHPHPGQKGQAALAALGSQGPPAAPQQAPASQQLQRAPQPPQPPQTQPPPQGAQADPYAAIASNPVASTQLATYAQARQMLDPQWRQASEQQQAQLVAQGLNPNSAAYQNSMQLFGNQQNQAYDSALFGAINAGDQEQNTLYGQNLASGQFANSAQNQNYNQLMGQAQLGDAAQLQNYNEQLGRANLYNTANGQQFGQNLAAGQFANAAQGQQNSQNAAAAGFYNTAQSQGAQQQLANAQLANSAAQQQFQNQAYAQNLPINEFNSLMSSSQVGMPPSAPAQNTPVAPTNALGAYGLQQNALQNDYDAQMQNSQSGLGGLFNLGSAALKAFGPFKI